MTVPSFPVWLDPQGQPVACVEKIKVMQENLVELQQVAQDARIEAHHSERNEAHYARKVEKGEKTQLTSDNIAELQYLKQFYNRHFSKNMNENTL